jgi:hypothetical protein
VAVQLVASRAVLSSTELVSLVPLAEVPCMNAFASSLLCPTDLADETSETSTELMKRKRQFGS